MKKLCLSNPCQFAAASKTFELPFLETAFFESTGYGTRELTFVSL